MFKMIKKIIYKIAKALLYWSLDKIYNFIDTNKDGKLSKKELAELTKKIKRLHAKIRK